MLYAIVAALVIIIDQWVKYWVANNLEYGFGVKELIPNIISLVNVHNDGAAFSFLSGTGARIWFIALCGVFTVLVIIALATRLISGPVGRWSAVFVVAGGLSNCIDRILYGYVQDMFKVEFVNFAVFNVADIFITVFCIVFIIYVLVGERPHNDDDYEDEDDEDDYDDDDEYGDEDDEDEKPVRKKAKKPSRASRRAAAIKADEEEEDEDEDEIPVKAKAKPASRKERQSKYDADYEQYKASKASRVSESLPVQQPAPAKKTVKASAETDPFAEWDAANRKAGNSSAASPATVAKKPAATTEDVRVYAKQAASVNATPSKASAPVRAVPAAAPTVSKPAATPKKADEEFSLDDILAEFK